MFKNKKRLLAFILIAVSVVLIAIKVYDASIAKTLSQDLFGIILWEGPVLFLGFILLAFSSNKKRK